MPLLGPTDRITLTGKAETFQADLLAETSGRLFLLLQSDAPVIRNETTLHGEVMQGTYRGSFLCRVLYCDRDLHTGRQLLLLDYPPVFRRERIQ